MRLRQQRKAELVTLTALIWNGLNLLLLPYLLLHQSAFPSLLGRYSMGYGVGLAGALVTSLLIFAWTITRSRNWTAARRSHPLLLILVLVGLMAFALLPLEAAPLRLWLGVNGLLLGLTIAESGGVLVPRAWSWAGGIGLVALLIIIGYFSAYRVPGPESSGDEVMWADTARNWLITHKLYLRINFAPPVPIAPGVGYWLIPLAEWFGLFGPSFASARLFVWLAWVGVIAAVGIAGLRLYGRRVGVAAACIAASSALLLSERLLRPEFMLPTAGSLILICYLNKVRGWGWSFACGWLAILSLEIHASGIAYAAAATALYVYDGFRLRRSGESPFRPWLIAFVVGGVVGSLIYVLTHILILPEPGYFAVTLRAGRGFLSFAEFVPQLTRVPVRYWEIAPLETVALLLAFIGLVRRGTALDWLLLRAMVFTAVAYATLVPIPQNYFVLLLPYVAIAIAALVVQGLSSPRTMTDTRVWGIMVALVALAGPFITISAPAVRFINPFPQAAIGQTDRCIRALSSAEARLAVMFESYWALTDYTDVYAINARTSYSNYAPLLTEFTPWDLWPPDVIAHYPRAYAPTLPPELAGFVALNGYRQIAEVEANNQTVTIWWRDGYEPAGWRERVDESCPMARLNRRQ